MRHVLPFEITEPSRCLWSATIAFVDTEAITDECIGLLREAASFGVALGLSRPNAEQIIARSFIRRLAMIDGLAPETVEQAERDLSALFACDFRTLN
jgi:hypothetical protein